MDSVYQLSGSSCTVKKRERERYRKPIQQSGSATVHMLALYNQNDLTFVPEKHKAAQNSCSLLPKDKPHKKKSFRTIGMRPQTPASCWSTLSALLHVFSCWRLYHLLFVGFMWNGNGNRRQASANTTRCSSVAGSSFCSDSCQTTSVPCWQIEGFCVPVGSASRKAEVGWKLVELKLAGLSSDSL